MQSDRDVTSGVEGSLYERATPIRIRGKEFDKRLKIGSAVVPAATVVSSGRTGALSTLGWVLGGIAGLGVGLGSTVIPSAGIVVRTCLRVVRTKWGRKEIREALAHACCRRREERGPYKEKRSLRKRCQLPGNFP
ncbi:MAG: hypothetical protein OXF02_07845 [Simkaniaceae bacterium]|nr:hypothetical protein [Simkaniaceae bacterium]